MPMRANKRELPVLVAKRFKSAITLGIDTGTRAAGWAIIEWRSDHDGSVAACGVVAAPRMIRDLHKCAACLVNSIAEGVLAAGLSPSTAVLELPVVRMTDAKGLSAAARGDVVGLAYMAGMMAAMLHAQEKTRIELATPAQWKGQLSKAVVEDRLTRVFGTRAASGEPIQSHAWDAVGLAAWAHGLRMDDELFMQRKAVRGATK